MLGSMPHLSKKLWDAAIFEGDPPDRACTHHIDTSDMTYFDPLKTNHRCGEIPPGSAWSPIAVVRVS